MDQNKRPILLGYLLLTTNTILFILKLMAFFLSNSIAILSDALNSLTDILSSVVVAYSIKIGRKAPDKEHPFGHERIEPLAALFVALVAAFLAINIVKDAFFRFMNQETVTPHPVSIAVICFTIVLKLFLYVYLGKASDRYQSPSLEAGSIDARNDMVVSAVVLIGLFATTFHFPFFDPLAAILLGLWILKTAYELGKKNIDFLTGRRANAVITKKIEKTLADIVGIQSVKTLNTHYVGHKVQVEVVITVADTMSIKQSHDVADKVESSLLRISTISKVFVHVEPT